MQTHKERRPPVLPVIALMAGGLAVVLALTATPWHLVPAQVTEDVAVIAVTGDGCVGESALGVSVVVGDCGAQPGDTVPATFYVPSMEIDGYHDRAEARLSAVHP